MVRIKFYTALFATSMILAVPAYADNAGPQNKPAPPPHLAPSGAKLYANICQACHMEDARGATGAATIPALAGNQALSLPGYPISVVLYGKGAMPAMGKILDDAQIAAVLNYVRQNFGNKFPDAITAAAVKSARVPGREYSDGY